jgi:soluble cytochrome b562
MSGFKVMDIKNLSLINLIEPKKQNRFYVTLQKELDIPEWVIKSAERPKFKFNGYHLIPEPIKLSFYDPISPSTTQRLWEILIGISDIESGTQVEEHLKVEYQKEFKDITNGFDYTMEILDPIGHTVEKWEIKKAIIKNIDFGSFSWDKDDPCEITMTVLPSKVTLIF